VFFPSSGFSSSIAAFETGLVRSSGFEDEEAFLMVRLKTVVAIGALVAVGVLTAVPAYAQSTYEGKVTANGGLLVRHLPTAASATEGRLNNGQQIEIICKVRGSSVNGNDSWYSPPTTLNEWDSARYVQNIGSATRWCGSTERFVGRTTAAVKKRAAPTTASAQVGFLANRAGVDIICKLEGQTVSGNNLWYFSTDYRWVAARYVKNVGRAPGWCN
jgi:hypothetical protein